LSFQQLQVIEPILKALHNEGYTNPTPIQQQSIPAILQRRDILGCAQTGTGKTAAFAIPVLQLLYQDKLTKAQSGIKALVLSPTRELAIQIQESFAAYGKFTNLSHACIIGGVSQHAQVQAIRKEVDILIATPGRLLDLMQQNLVSLQNLKLLVLDEADRMLDMGFEPQVRRIVEQMDMPLPGVRQTMLFSATFPKEIQVSCFF